ncbi:type VI secretion protein [Klebsiella pneumoniae]|nr:type VI secretion protein [Klebsiella pneumoniae]
MAKRRTSDCVLPTSKIFEPEQVARQIPQLRAMLAMRNLLRDLKSNLLDNATFRKELEAILKDPALSQELRDEMSALGPEISAGQVC